MVTGALPCTGLLLLAIRCAARHGARACTRVHKKNQHSADTKINQELVAELLKAGADANSSCRYVGQTPLYMATSTIPALLPRTNSPCFVSSLPFSFGAILQILIRFFAGWGRVEAVQVLLQYGADPHKPDKFGKNAFDALLASPESNARMQQLLMQHSA